MELEDMRVCISPINNPSNFVWVSLPINEDEVIEQLEVVNDELEVCDEENTPISFENMSIDEINDFYEIFKEINDYDPDIYEATNELCKTFFNNDIKSLNEAKEDIVVYVNQDMGDIAKEFLFDTGYVNKEFSAVDAYFNYDDFGEDLESDGYYLEACGNVYYYVS